MVKNTAKEISEKLGAKLSKRGLSEFKQGLEVELEHGTHGPKNEGLNTDVTKDDPIKTGKIALIHLTESPTYYTDLEKMEDRGEKEGKKKGLKAIIRKTLKK
jgi:hypothetical protein